MFYLKKESGSAIIITTMMGIISAILISSYVMVVNQESRHSVWQKERVQSLFLAEAGVQKAIYYLNYTDYLPQAWRNDEGGMADTPLERQEELDNGMYYKIYLHDRNEDSYQWLPIDTYFIESAGIINKANKDVENSISCIVTKAGGLEMDVPGALSIFDDTDGEDELNNFNSQAWIVDGRDHDVNANLINPIQGIPGIAVANNGDNLPGQLSNGKKAGKGDEKWVDQLIGSDEDGNFYDGENAILEDSSLPKNLDHLLTYFKNHPLMIDLTDTGTHAGHTTFGGPNPIDYGIFYADLGQGTLHLSGQAEGYGVLVLEGDGELRLTGNFEWDGIIICAGMSHIVSTGGGNSTHINGALMIADGYADIRGNADLTYSSATIANINEKFNNIPYSITAWSGKWGIDPSSEGYVPDGYTPN